jgi:hypothetical protein
VEVNLLSGKITLLSWLRDILLKINKMRNILATALISILLCSCYKSREKEEVHVRLKEEVYNLVASYIDSHPQYNTYILTEAMEQTMSGIKTSGYFLGPGYQGLLTSEKSTTYLDINNCRIYIISNLSSLYELDNDAPIWKNTNPTDSVVLDGVVMYDLVYNFLHNGLFIYYSNSEMKIMERPDTFFTPYIKSNVVFENKK